MNMKKTVAAVAASAMAISAIAVPANAAVENAVATGTSFTYSLVKEYTLASFGSANIAASFNANPATDLIVISLKGTASEAPVTITATAVDGDVRFTPFTFIRSGVNKDVNLGAGYKLVGDTLTINAGAFSNVNTEATFTVSGLANGNLNGAVGDGSKSQHTEKYQDDLRQIAEKAEWLNVTVNSDGSEFYTDAQIALAVEAQTTAEGTEKAAIIAEAIKNPVNVAQANAAATLDPKVAAAKDALDKAKGAGANDNDAYYKDLIRQETDKFNLATAALAADKQALAEAKTAAEVLGGATRAAYVQAAEDAVYDAAMADPENIVAAAQTENGKEGGTDCLASFAATTDYDTIAEVRTIAWDGTESYNDFMVELMELADAAVVADTAGTIAAAGTQWDTLTNAVTSAQGAYDAQITATGDPAESDALIKYYESQLTGAGGAVDVTEQQTAYDDAYAAFTESYLQGLADIEVATSASLARIEAAGLSAYQAYLNSVDPAGTTDGASGVPASWRLTFSGFVAAGTGTVKVPYKSFANYENDGPANIIEWLSTKVTAGKYSGWRWTGDDNRNGLPEASELTWFDNVQMEDTADVDKDGIKSEPAWSVNNYVNVQAVINDCIANYPNVTFTFNTATDKVATASAQITDPTAGAWYDLALTDAYSGWAATDLYQNAFKQYIYNNFGSDPSTYVPFDPGAYFTNGVGYNLFTGALIINDLYTMQLADTEMFSYNATSLVFDYQALKDNAYASYNNTLNMIYSMKLATSVPWYWDSMTISFAAATDDTADSDAGTSSEDEPLPEEPADAPAEEVETLPAETEAPATEAPVAPAANPGTGNAPVALAVIPVALAAAAIIAKKRK